MEKVGVRTFILVFIIYSSHSLPVNAQPCKPSGRIRGQKPPPGHCNLDLEFECCLPGKLYTTYECSPPVSNSTKAILTISSFEKDGAGYGPSRCDGHYHSDDTPLAALSSGWYKGGDRCLGSIKITANGRSVEAMVVDVCDSTVGCDGKHFYNPPCRNNVVDASKAVWKALDVPVENWDEIDITWSDA